MDAKLAPPLWPLALVLLAALPTLATCEAEPIEGAGLGECSDGADNDADGMYDCDDPDCSERAACLPIAGDDDDSSASGCRQIETPDCNANCAPTEWLGDGLCDNGAYPYYGNLIDYACPDLEFDNGDCEATGDDDDATSDDDDITDDDDSAVETLSFSEIYAVISMNCNCHSNSAHESGFAFDGGQDSLYESWLGSAGGGQASFQNPSMMRIAPGDSTMSYVMHKLSGTHLSVGGEGSRMPQGGPFLTNATLEGLRAWIDAGATRDE